MSLTPVFTSAGVSVSSGVPRRAPPTRPLGIGSGPLSAAADEAVLRVCCPTSLGSAAFPKNSNWVSALVAVCFHQTQSRHVESKTDLLKMHLSKKPRAGHSKEPSGEGCLWIGHAWPLKCQNFCMVVLSTSRPAPTDWEETELVN